MKRSAKFREMNALVQEDMKQNLSQVEIMEQHNLTHGQWARHICEIALIHPELLNTWRPTGCRIALKDTPSMFQSMFRQLQADTSSYRVIFEVTGEAGGTFQIEKNTASTILRSQGETHDTLRAAPSISAADDTSSKDAVKTTATVSTLATGGAILPVTFIPNR